MAHVSRRSVLSALALLGGQSAIAARAVEMNAVAKASPFSFEELEQRASALARTPFVDTNGLLPREIDKLEYDAWRDIRFRPEHAIPLDGANAFRLETFHLGFLYRRPIKINLISEGVASPVLYSPNFFDYGRVRIDAPLPANLGFSGFRLHYPLNNPHVSDELISFLGASYFRFLGRDQQYGLSARALCVEAGTAKECFPFFREFWLEKATSGVDAVTIYALLDSDAATGAFRFRLKPGQEATLDVNATLFPRRPNVKFGLAPLTSMFMTGENDHRVRDNFRVELHDSDGLLMQTGSGEWIWRPLANPQAARTTSFVDQGPKGFGLLQRDRMFESYQDLELAYEARPSYFVEPIGDWGAGRVELIELSTQDETNDNIVASWTPSISPTPLQPFRYAYRTTAFLDLPGLSPGGQAVNTFTAPARALGSAEEARANSCRFLVDFAKGDLAYYVSDPAQVEVVASTTHGAILRTGLAANPHIEGLRALIDVSVPSGVTTDLRVYLRTGSRTLTETWTTPWTPSAAASQASGDAVQNKLKREMHAVADQHAATLTDQSTQN
jgi:periplasmic glucans biosynthesis protein